MVPSRAAYLFTLTQSQLTLIWMAFKIFVGFGGAFFIYIFLLVFSIFLLILDVIQSIVEFIILTFYSVPFVASVFGFIYQGILYSNGSARMVEDYCTAIAKGLITWGINDDKGERIDSLATLISGEKNKLDAGLTAKQSRVVERIAQMDERRATSVRQQAQRLATLRGRQKSATNTEVAGNTGRANAKI